MSRPALLLAQHGVSPDHVLALEARLGHDVLDALNLVSGDVLERLLELLPAAEQQALHQRWSPRLERRRALELRANGGEPAALSRSTVRVERDLRVRDVVEVLARVVVAGPAGVQ